ncbi:MAG TPA: alpha/beta fold hydrolase [Sedimentisphaerales bacterium]|nr:alpha/beta fold hydrolase [Sedimentisphaerales bacterium]
MRNKSALRTAISVALILITALSTLIKGAETEDIEGIWMGTLKVSVVELRIVFKINANADGTLAATLDSPDQGAENITVNKVTFENGRLYLESKVIQGTYEGQIKEDGSIEGKWQQGGISFPLSLKRIDEAPTLHRPQEPKKPYPYIEEEVTYENEKAGIKLAGTLTLPHSEGPFPAVILITGSGGQDRNETVCGHRPFLVLADYLTRRGIAVLRVDDRGVGGSTGNLLESTSEDFAGDVLTGVNYLKSRKEVNPKKIGLIGHSEGGIIAPIAAVRASDVAFIVLMAGTGLTGEEIIYLQSDLILKTVGASDKVLTIQRTSSEQIFEILKQEKDNTIAEKKIRKIMTDILGKLSKEEKDALGASEATIEIQLKMLLSQWCRFFLTYDPKTALMKVKCPVLAINGQLDLQVPPKENLSAIEEALKTGGNTNYTIQELPKHNHLFQRAQTGAISEYAKIEETISPIALKAITQWILKQTSRANK